MDIFAKISHMQILKFIVSLGLPQFAGLIGSYLAGGQISTYYAELTKPTFAPSPAIFGPVWIVLYILMGIALFLVWSSEEDEMSQSRYRFWFFFIHLIVNASWTPIFFGLQNPGAALIVIIILWLMIGMMIIDYRSINRTASYLMIPYLLWVLFATFLNFSIWFLGLL